jgi:hypothetical protein
VPTGTRAAKDRKRRAVAGGVIAGLDSAGIAKAAGCKARYAQRLANDPETQFLIAEALAPHRAKLALMAQRAVYAVDTALLAKKTDKADHITRLRAVERYGDLLGLAQGKPREAAEERLQVTWEQFTLMYEKRTEVHP